MRRSFFVFTVTATAIKECSKALAGVAFLVSAPVASLWRRRFPRHDLTAER